MTRAPVLGLAGILGPGLSLAVGFGLAGCVSSPATHLYALKAYPGVTAAAPAASVGARLQLRGVNLPPQFDRPEITETPDRGPLKTYPFAQWAAPLPEMIQATLAADLLTRLPPGRLVESAAPTPPDASLLRLDILSLHLEGGAAEAEVSWARTPPHGGAIIIRTARIEVPARGHGADADAQALSRLLEAIADRMAADLASS